MEYNERKTKPESNRKILVQQVNEQSSLCDVTVKIGLWEKKFHRCILVTSPFFDHVLNDNFLEKQTGKIEIGIGTSISLEAAIMFLYGKKPKLKNENVADILHMAEFLLIPNLKSACIAWMKSATITEENCMRLLQLSSVYDFEIPKCINYIEEHLPEMLMVQQMVNLTKESIYLLFSDKRLSYVPMDDKLLFILKWTNAIPSTRKDQLKELLMTIDFRLVSKQCLRYSLHNPDVADFIQSEQISTLTSELDNHRVLIMNDDNNNDAFWCLDLERDHWFRVQSESLKERSSRCIEISGSFSKIPGSVVCSMRQGYQEISHVMLNIATDTCTILNITGIKDDLKPTLNYNLKIRGNMCSVFVNEKIKSKQKLDETSEFRNIERKVQLMELMGLKFGKLIAMSTPYVSTSTLYIGQIDRNNMNMTPLISFKDDEILKFAINENSIAIIFKSRKYVVIYDIPEGHLEKIAQATNYNDNIVSWKDGYVIYDDQRCITISRVKGACLYKYHVEELSFEQNKYQLLKYFICNEVCYRYYRKDYTNNFVFECTPIQTLISRKPEHAIVWKELPLPKEAELWSHNTIKESFFEIHLPISKLRCHIECPHCKMTGRATTSRSTYYRDFSDDYYYDDSSSDDDFYVSSNHDDYDYYYDSD